MFRQQPLKHGTGPNICYGLEHNARNTALIFHTYDERAKLINSLSKF